MHPDVARNLNNLATLLQDMGDYAEGRLLHERALRVREQALGPTHPDVAQSLSNLAFLLQAMGNYAEARPLYERALQIREQVLGPTHPDVAQSLNNLAFLLQATGDYAGARPLYERARRVLLSVGRTNVDLGDEGLQGLLRREKGALYAYVRMLATIARDPTQDPRPPIAAQEAFVLVEQTRGGAAQTALVRAGARAAAADGAIANLARAVQELRDRRQALSRQLAAEYGKPTARHAARLDALQRTVRQADQDLATAAERLFAVFPRYAALAAPEPIDMVGVQQLLRVDEGLVSYFTLPDRVLVWVVRPGAIAYREVSIGHAALSARVGRVRASLDQRLNPDLAAGRLLPFDVAGAHELYRLLLEPLRPDLAGVKHLIVVPDEVLLPLPFGVLVTRTDGDAYRKLGALAAQQRAPAGPELTGYAQLSWLAKQYAITVLPSATSLRALRQIARAKGTGVEPFVGFGDPELQGSGRERGGPMLAGRGGMALAELRKLPRLPGTRDELVAVAQALGADPGRALYLGRRATAPEVLRLNGTGELGNARVVAFATHALIAGEVRGLRQPALVLTPPAVPSAKDDGLLSLEEVVGLKLMQTDWVILSACNTGASDGSGEGLSGLARAFFFAGAPSLLVSHWSVEDRATQALMTEVFRRYAADRGMSRAEAVQQGTLALMGQGQGATGYFAHPFAWAAFFLVGEGGEGRR
jgi:CHAT domain-containing protein